MTTALVTGASSGIGKETAKRLLEAGYTVYVAARRVEKMEDLAALGAVPVAMDVTKEEDVAAVVERIGNEQGGVEVLVNNAGFGLYGPVEEVSLDDARYQFEVNLFGLADLTRRVLPGMRERRSGKIVNVSSVGGKIYTPLGAWYHATKHALEGWSDCLRLELSPFGIDVIVIEPGMIRTEFVDRLSDRFDVGPDSPYAGLARRLEAATRATYEKPGSSSPPGVIGDLILKAVQTRKPKTRYAGGKLAKPLLFLRRWLPDRLFDKAVMSQF